MIEKEKAVMNPLNPNEVLYKVHKWNQMNRWGIREWDGKYIDRYVYEISELTPKKAIETYLKMKND